MNFNEGTVSERNDEKKVKIGAVSYLNSKPLIHGLEKGMMKNEAELVIDYPANIAQSLLNNTIDMGLVPVAIIPEMKEYHINTDYCISCDGAVESVCLFSDVPMAEIETVILDYQSRTSVLLVQILLKEYWKKNVVFEKADQNFQEKIKDNTAAVVIGDRTFDQRSKSAYCYDLGLAWKNFTGLPFVFAAWISNKEIPADFINDFNQANEYGLQHLQDVIDQYQTGDIDLETYYTRFIQYRLNDKKREGLKLFLQKCKDLENVLVEAE